MKTVEKMRSEFSKEFDITEDRLTEISSLVEKEYASGAEKGLTVISLMYMMRDLHAKNVKEDMFICYIIGYIHHESMTNKNQSIFIALK